jgi:serine protease Do
MRKQIIVITGLIIVICSGLLVGCTTAKDNSPVASTNGNTTSISQQISPSPTTSITDTTGNNIVNLPSFADLLAIAEHSVVKIDTVGTGTDIFGRTVQQQAAGSGWIIDGNGTTVTNNHVIEGADTITVTTLDGKTYPATVVDADSGADIAVLKIDAVQLPPLKVGDASKLRVGDWVLAIGNPLGEGIIATQGIVSRLGVNLQISSTQTYKDLIETTAAINPGNSGGPLINLSGEVIGITSAKVAVSGIEGMGYAINMVDAFPVIQKLSSK